MNNWKLRALVNDDDTMDLYEANGHLGLFYTSDVSVAFVPFGDKFAAPLRTSASDDFGPVSNQVPGICNGTFTHTGAGSATVSATTLTGEGSSATFTYTFIADGTLSTIVAASGGSNYKVGDKLRITTSSSHGSQVIEFRLVDGSNAKLIYATMSHDRTAPSFPFAVHKFRINNSSARPVAVLDYRSSQVFPRPRVQLLDKYPGAAAAYGLRKLRSAYLGPAIRVRSEASGFPEIDVYFDGAGNLDTAALLDFAGTNSVRVTTWYDQSGNGNDASQSGTSAQPTIVGGGVLRTVNGKPALDFDGNDDNLANATLTNELDNSDFLVSAVYGDDLVMGITSSIPRLYLQDNAFSYNNINVIEYTAQTGHKLLSFQVVGATQEVFANGSSLGTATEAQVAFTPSAFNLNIAGSAYGSGKMQEVVVYASDQSANRAAIETHMNNYWDIY